MKHKNETLKGILDLAPVIPVVTFDDTKSAVETSRALVAGGLPVIEITLRTPIALECMAAVIKQVDGAIVGAGTVLNRTLVNDCVEIGAQFLVSPGATQELLDAVSKTDIPLLPGVATPSEAMGLATEGSRYLKFFPAERAGGTAYLKDMGAVFPDLKFCPTGGLNATNAPDYLALDNVICVGGSWVAPPDLVKARDWDGISALAEEAAALAG